MANYRDVPKVLISALVTNYNLLRTDAASALNRANNRILSRIPLAALIADSTAVRAEVVKAVADAAMVSARNANRVLGYALVADGTAAGKLKTTNTVSFSIAGAVYTKAATDDLWDLSAEIDTIADQYRAYWLYIDSAGAASVVGGTVAASSAAAIAALPSLSSTKAVFGCYVAGPVTDFNGVAGLDSYGDIYNGFPSAYTLTAAAPAALTSSVSVGIGNGGTAGRLRINADAEYTIGGVMYRKASADDVWNLSAETATTGAQYRAYWLYVDSAGTATVGAGTNAASASAALLALPALSATKAVLGVYVAGLSTVFTNALAAQGTIYDGFPGATTGPDAAAAVAITVVSP